MDGTVLVGTDNGLHILNGEGRSAIAERPIGALAGEGGSLWALVEQARILRSTDGDDWREVGALPDGRATCLLPTADGLLVGTAEAHLLRLAGAGWEPLEAFETVEGRAGWYTPWGGPPDTRSLSRDGEGTVYVNVHVGGIPASGDGGRTWRPTIDVDADVHQVLASAGRPGLVLAASARGLAISEDGGRTWRFETGGLSARYCRAVAIGDRMLFVSASSGPSGRQAALYRRALDGDAPFTRCDGGLPESFTSNIDTYCLDAASGTVAFGTEAGSVYLSRDEGATWEEAMRGLAPVRCVLVRT